MLTLRVAFRNLFRQKRRSFFTALMMAGGFWFCSISLGMTEGSFSSIIRFFTSDHTGHLQIHKSGYLDQPSLQKTLSDWPDLARKLSCDPKILSACPRLYTSALAFCGSKTVGLRITGVDTVLEAQTCSLKAKVEQGSYFPTKGMNDVLIGNGIAKSLDLRPGSELALISQGADGSVANDLFRVVGILGGKTGTDAIDRNLYLRLSDAQRFLSMPGRFHEVAVILKDIQTAPQEARDIEKRLADPSLDIQPWQVVEVDFFKAMQVNKKYKSLVQLIFQILVALSVLNTVLMNLLERIPEYGLMKSLGTRSSSLTGMIFSEMVLLALLSMIPGAAASWAVNAYLARWGFPLPHAFTYGGMVYSTLYGHVSWVEFVVPGILILTTAILVSLPAAWRVWKLTPLEALRKV